MIEGFVALVILVVAVYASIPRRRAGGDSDAVNIHYPRIVGYDGVWCNGYTDNKGKYVKPGYEFTIVEIAEREYRFVEHGKELQ